MKLYAKCKSIIIATLIVCLLCSPISLLITEASERNQNSTASYNCYAYAINEIIFDEAFYYLNSNKPRYQPGDISEDIYNNFDYNINSYDLNRVKCNTLSDLYALGYTDIEIYNNINDFDAYNSMIESTDFSTKELICFRVGSEDYHFMRYDPSTNAWYNKIGYDSIFKYTDNNGIPSNDIPWVGAGVYDSNIVYLAFNRLQINTTENGNWEGIITVKGGVTNTSTNNYVFCCSDEACCNPNGICMCDNEVINGGKDVLYEIVVPQTGCYNINLNSGHNGFNYEIYSYNMYSGDYQILSQGTDVLQVNCNLMLTATEDYESPYSVNKYYLRADFGRSNNCEKYIVVSISQQHTYTNGYESISTTMHNSSCVCGAHIEERHEIVNNRCVLCDAEHIHQYTDSCVNVSNTHHKSYCWCGNYIKEYHEIVNNRCVICNAEHTHQYTDYSYNEEQGSTHEVYCWCGEYILEEHSTRIDDCPLCGAPHSHDYTDHYSRVSGKEHRSYCACGESKLAGHVVVVGSGGLLNNKICMLCLGMVEIGSSIILSPTQLPRSENGSYFTPDGIIVLVEDDVEAYLNGTLVFYEQNEDWEVM